MAVSSKIEAIMEKSSWIRKMFEEGTRLKAIHGDQNVFDFSIGNPIQPPPPQFNAALIDTVKNLGPGDHGYLPNPGYPFVRKAIADQVSIENDVTVADTHITITCGAAGALNVVLKTILNPGEEVVVPAPYFVEYGFYADNHGGVLKAVPTRSDFSLDIDAMASAITEKTRAVIINSPNNPTGQIYTKQNLSVLGSLLREKSALFGSAIYLISDEPYRKIVYDDVQVPSIFSVYAESMIITSYSKDISIPGERLGFIALSPQAVDSQMLLNGLALSNRILGFVNAPALMQRVVAAVQGATIDMSAYARKREILCRGLAEAGYEFVTPPGAFYLFPKSPVADDVAFVQALQEELILTVPGSGFGGPGYFRISFSVPDETITGALPGFKKVMAKFR
ncbi:MAG: pyridoxal phosphate-dependent aminotransferase [Deltaproteobacteria bacterium]|nr:pyridoxal phosphate-dependent aminotransferase [Deltaproteobacteria bacterium]